MRANIRRFGAPTGAAFALLALGLAGCTRPAAPRPAMEAAAVSAADAGGPIGPEPTEQRLLAATGPLPISQSPANGAGFNNGTIYYPSDQSITNMAAIVVVPGFISSKSSIEWYGPRLASWGFVVMTINTNTPLD